MRRVRHTHAKFAALNASTAPPEDEEQGVEGGAGGGVYGSVGAGGTAIRGGMPSAIGAGLGFGLGEDDSVADRIDEGPWSMRRGKKGKIKNISGVEIGEANATDCLHWAGNKILEHVGFQGVAW